MAKVDEEQLARLRAMGVKSIGFFEGELATVEFFPRGLLDVGSLVPENEDLTPTDRPPAEDVHVPPAIARILSKGSVS